MDTSKLKMLMFAVLLHVVFMPFASALLYDITGNTNNINLLALTNKRPPGPGESEIWRDRNIYSEFFHLVPQLRRNPARFHNYYRMSIASVDYILEFLTPQILVYENMAFYSNVLYKML